MKIFMTILIATSLRVATSDISLKSDYTHKSGKNLPQTFYIQQQQPPLLTHRQSHYTPDNILSRAYLEPSAQYLPSLEQPQEQQFSNQIPASADLPVVFSFKPAVHQKTARRYRPRTRIPKKPSVTKHFYIHSAPEETQAEIDEELAALGHQARKHYNVLFVKTPSQTHKAAALTLAKGLKEEKTVVYVLAKKTSAADLQDSIQEAQQHSSKPEVFFIRYRTAEEAADAQRQIQSQYDSLGGSTIVSDEGIAPATSVVGSLDASEEEEEKEEPEQQLGGHSEEQDQQNLLNSLPSSESNAYLPPANPF